MITYAFIHSTQDALSSFSQNEHFFWRSNEFIAANFRDRACDCFRKMRNVFLGQRKEQEKEWRRKGGGIQLSRDLEKIKTAGKSGPKYTSPPLVTAKTCVTLFPAVSFLVMARLGRYKASRGDWLTICLTVIGWQSNWLWLVGNRGPIKQPTSSWQHQNKQEYRYAVTGFSCYALPVHMPWMFCGFTILTAWEPPFFWKKIKKCKWTISQHVLFFLL